MLSPTAVSELDALIQRQDRLLALAQVYQAHPRIVARIIATRNQLVQTWGRATELISESVYMGDS